MWPQDIKYIYYNITQRFSSGGLRPPEGHKLIRVGEGITIWWDASTCKAGWLPELIATLLGQADSWLI